mmetsp:Transcript_29768/g.81605  ORF Transcript_29768/g.81605 Transcript_29768/m.81605 type:complete len:317 (-) Transcript_29768:298-1248(-)
MVAPDLRVIEVEVRRGLEHSPIEFLVPLPHHRRELFRDQRPGPIAAQRNEQMFLLCKLSASSQRGLLERRGSGTADDALLSVAVIRVCVEDLEQWRGLQGWVQFGDRHFTDHLREQVLRPGQQLGGRPRRSHAVAARFPLGPLVLVAVKRVHRAGKGFLKVGGGKQHGHQAVVLSCFEAAPTLVQCGKDDEGLAFLWQLPVALGLAVPKDDLLHCEENVQRAGDACVRPCHHSGHHFRGRHSDAEERPTGRSVTICVSADVGARMARINLMVNEFELGRGRNFLLGPPAFLHPLVILRRQGPVPIVRRRLVRKCGV